MDATWAYEKGDSKGICITGDNGKLIIYMSKREGGKLVYEYCTLPNEISISKTADGEFVFVEGPDSIGDALQAADKLLEKLRSK
jgi:hypothetical protein